MVLTSVLTMQLQPQCSEQSDVLLFPGMESSLRVDQNLAHLDNRWLRSIPHQFSNLAGIMCCTTS